MSDPAKYRPRDLARDLKTIANEADRAAERICSIVERAQEGTRNQYDEATFALRALAALADDVESALALIRLQEIREAYVRLNKGLERARRVAPKRDSSKNAHPAQEPRP